MKTMVFILGILIVTGCQKMNDTENMARQLLEADREFARTSLEIGAAKAFNQFLADSALQLPAGSIPLEGRETIYQAMLEGDDQIILDWTPQKAVVSSSGDLGYTWGSYTLTVRNPEGSSEKRFGKYLNVWQNSGSEGWKVLVDMGNASPAPDPD